MAGNGGQGAVFAAIRELAAEMGEMRREMRRMEKRLRREILRVDRRVEVLGIGVRDLRHRMERVERDVAAIRRHR